MVQGELLTTHTGGVHGYGCSPGGVISFRQGAGAASPGSPDLKTEAATEQRGSRECDFVLRGLHPEGVIEWKAASRGDQGPPARCPARPGVGPGQGRVLAPWQ